jgi:Putative restriction endonuclease
MSQKADKHLGLPNGRARTTMTMSTNRNGRSRVPELTREELELIDSLVIEDGKPVDSLFVEKQYRLLTEPLYSSWKGPGAGRPFIAVANVGLFFDLQEPPVVPDVMLSLDVVLGDISQKKNRSYFVRVIGKLPEVAIEIVSDKRGGEATHKLRTYARIGVKYYVILDPEEHLKEGVLRAFVLEKGAYAPIPASWLPGVGLGLRLWPGTYQGFTEECWLRWCDRRGKVYLTGQERAEKERQRAKKERKRAEEERQRSKQETTRAKRLEAQLRALGQEPSP